MLAFGVDPHKRLLVAAAVDRLGTLIAEWCCPSNTQDDWPAFFAWATQVADGQPFVVGIEGAHSLGLGLAQFVAAKDVPTFDINARWTAQRRRASRHSAKSDRSDALAIATFTLAEHASLPALPVDVDTPQEVLEVIGLERAELERSITQLRNRAHAILTKLDPRYRSVVGPLTSAKAPEAILAFLPALHGARKEALFARLRRLAEQWVLLRDQLELVSEQMRALAKESFAPLIAIHGVAALSAAQIIAAVGSRSFRSEAQFANYAGVSPIEASTSGRTKHRLSRSGNRKLNAIIHRVAVSQKSTYKPAQDYCQRRMSEGKTARESMRALKRHIARSIYRQLRACSPRPQAPRPSSA